MHVGFSWRGRCERLGRVLKTEPNENSDGAGKRFARGSMSYRAASNAWMAGAAGGRSLRRRSSSTCCEISVRLSTDKVKPIRNFVRNDCIRGLVRRRFGVNSSPNTVTMQNAHRARKRYGSSSTVSVITRRGWRKQSQKKDRPNGCHLRSCSYREKGSRFIGNRVISFNRHQGDRSRGRFLPRR